MLIYFFYFIVFGNKRGIRESDEKKRGMLDFREKGEECWTHPRNPGADIGGEGKSKRAEKNGPKSKLRGRSLLFFAPFFEKIFIDKIPFS